MASEKSPALLLQASKTFPQRVHLNLIKCCPTMDLVAVVTEDEQVDVYRFNGQRAFGLQRRDPESEVSSICWKYNGTYLALGWSDGAVEVISTETGNVLQQFRQVTSTKQDRQAKDESTSRGIDCIGWGMNLTKDRGETLRGRNEAVEEHSDQYSMFDYWETALPAPSVDELLDRTGGSQRSNIPDELPAMLARLDAMSLFPKLPILPLLPPAAYRSGAHPAVEMFSSHQSLDPALHGSTEESYSDLDILLLSDHNGSTRLVLYDSLNIGKVDLPSSWQISRARSLQHCSHPYSNCHMFLTELETSKGNPTGPRIALIPLSLRFLETRGQYLQIISSKAAQLELLLQYISECLFALQYHWTHAQDLPKRFMGLINETLEEKKETATLVQLLYHLAATGDCPPVLKEWLSDEVAERGHKRWDQSIDHGYVKVLQLTHENFLPALDRCSAILTRIHGLVEHHKDDSDFGINPSHFTHANDLILSLRLLGHQVLIYASEEHRQFQQFSKWFRHEIDVQATDPSSSTAEETLEKDIGLDYGGLLGYIEGPLEKSKILPFLAASSDNGAAEPRSYSYRDVKEGLSAFKEGEDSDGDSLHLSARLQDLGRYCERIIGKITEWQRQSSIISCGLVLEDEEIKFWDMRMVPEERMATYIAVVTASKASELRLHRIEHTDPFDGAARAGMTLEFGTEKIMDVKFVDDDQIMLLTTSEDGSSRLLSMPYRGTHSTGFTYTNLTGYLPLCMLPDGKGTSYHESITITIKADQVQRYIRHVFAATDTFKPARIEVNGRKKRRICVVLSEDGQQMRIYDLDFKADAEDNWVAVGVGEDGGDQVMVD